MVSYATRANLAAYGMPSAVLASVSTQDQDAHLDAASRIADGYLRKRYSVPLGSWWADLTMYVCWLAQFSILVTRGFAAVDTDSWVIVKSQRDMAIEWLIAVSAGDIEPIEQSQDATPYSDENSVYMESEEPRGW